MKVFVYSARSYDRPVLEAAAGNHELLFTEERLKIDTAYYAEGCQAVAIFTSDDASASVLSKLHAYGVRFVALRSVGYDHVDLEKAASLGMRVANVPQILTLLSGRTCRRTASGFEQKTHSRSAFDECAGFQD